MTVITSNTYTGDGTTSLFSVSFPYIEESDVSVSVGGVSQTLTTDFIFSTSSVIQILTVPAVGAAISITRNTAEDALKATFSPGSAIRARDLNNNFTQNLYVTQETTNVVSTATTTANTAKTTADTALTNSSAAVTTANSTIATANTASTNATAAVTTANAASASAATANTTAASAVSTANAASAAVSTVVAYTLIANVAAIPGSPSNNDYIEIADSTGLQSFSPLSGVPSGYVGAVGLTARLRYDTSSTSWVWLNYFANDPETRYLTKNIPVVTGDSTNGSGQITLNCENNSHGVKIKGPPHSAAATYTLTLPNNTGTNGQALLTNGSGVMSWGTVATSGVLALTGGTMTGALTLSGAPTSNLHAATKAYVDSNSGSTGTIVADGGNFANGTSLISSSTTYDGGSFD